MAEPRKTRPVSWIKAALKDFEAFPNDAQSIFLTALTVAADGGKADVAKPMSGLGSGVFEVALAFRGDAFRVVYAIQLADEIRVIHEARYQDAQARGRSGEGSVEKTEGGTPMKDEKLELARGSGNVFRDLGREDGDLEQLIALLAAEIIKALDRDELTVRAAHARTGFAAADFSRIRNADLARFTADRLMSMLNRLGARVEVKIRVRPFGPVQSAVRA
jgi:phage-related protein/predicted XRE-type DNA-binding protein